MYKKLAKGEITEKEYKEYLILSGRYVTGGSG